MKFLLYSLLASLILVGCAGTSKVTEDKSMEAKQFVANPDKGTVYVYRTGRIVGAAGQIQVKINGIDAGGTGPGTFFKWDLEPGRYTFMSYTPESSKVVELNVEAGQQYFLRQDARMGLDAGRVTLVEKDANTGMKEVEGCKLLVSAYHQE